MWFFVQVNQTLVCGDGALETTAKFEILKKFFCKP
jgi:hypothetical protein